MSENICENCEKLKEEIEYLKKEVKSLKKNSIQIPRKYKKESLGMLSNYDQIKCVIIGDGAVGKTCMLITYTQDAFPGEEYVPTIFDNYETFIEHKKSFFRLSLWDTAGQEDYDRMRKMSYPGTNVFLICYSICNLDSLDNVEQIWLKELNDDEEAIDVPRLLVGCKLDTRDDEDTNQELKRMGRRTVTHENAMEVVRKEQNRISGYLECSSLEKTNLDLVFAKAVEVALSGMKIEEKPKDGKDCMIL